MKLKINMVREYTVYVKNVLKLSINAKPADVENKLLHR